MSTVFISGGSRGIGAASVRLFAQEGWNVVFSYVNQSGAAEALVRELEGLPVLALRADVRDTAAVEAAMAETVRSFGPPDALVCNAGIARPGLIQNCTDEDWAELFDVNAAGMHRCIRAALPHMLRRKAGRIVTVSSMWGISGAACETAYSATKGAVIAMTRALAMELAPSGITVNCVAPGAVDTDMLSGLSGEDRAQLIREIPLGRLGRPEEIAAAIRWLCSPEAGYLTGQVLSPNGGMVL